MSVACALIRMHFNYAAATHSRHVLDGDPKTAKERLVKIEPPDAALLSGALAPTDTVKPATMKGVWFPTPLKPDATGLQNERVVLHFPGGAFVISFDHEASGRPVFDVLAKHLKADRLLWAQYRLSADEETRFPAAIQDAVTYYHYVVSSGVDPKNIVLSGDSAGGNVVLALMRYLESSRSPELPLPGGAIVFSPWVKITSEAAQDFSSSKNAEFDMLTGPLLQWGADSYLPKDKDGTEAYTSPLHHPFRTSMPLYVHAGAAEAFCEPVESFAGEMEQIGGNRIRFHASPKGPHDGLLSHSVFGLTEEFCAAMDEAHGFLTEQG
ncbi:hypothetical protein diail_3362 [Diaporthe ilicicola]|nr:hypothetical protein diail_3362 [Diaporthe ilicicola]